MYVGLGCVWLGMWSSENASADAFVVVCVLSVDVLHVWFMCCVCQLE